MVVVGGCYHELCEVPYWDAVYGSGGRAAAAIADLSRDVELHTYFPIERRRALFNIEALGVQIHASPSESEVVFAYFHPLARPVIAPALENIKRYAPLRVSGESVLRFGLLEGDAIVEAGRAVYDPQQVINPTPFGANGSHAKSLAIVLNQHELLAVSGASDPQEGARRLMERDGASVVVSKDGIKGACLYEPGGQSEWIPAFYSTRVFKIGSGDVFTAAFAYYWAAARMMPAPAAELASRSVAHYCASAQLPLPRAAQLPSMTAIGSGQTGPICLVGGKDTLCARWLLEESLLRLTELGMAVEVVMIDQTSDPKIPDHCVALAVLADFLPDQGEKIVRQAERRGLSGVIFSEVARAGPPPSSTAIKSTDDFTTAMYWAAWSSIDH